MIRVLFVCHGNICRSPMAQFVMSDLVKKRGLSAEIEADSAAAHTDEIGSPPYYATVAKLREVGVPVLPHRAKLLTRADGESFDYIVCMDEYNLRDVKHILGENARKASMLLSFAGESGSVSDPWYTRDFDRAYEDILRGTTALLEEICNKMERGVSDENA